MLPQGSSRRSPPLAADTRTRLTAGPATAAALVLLLIGSAAALSIDVVEAGFSIKGDEATYVSMALSAAYDGDLAFERRDLERFWSIYGRGPEGIFLKVGKRVVVSADSTFPFVRITKQPDDRTDRLYHGKAFAYSVAAAPFVRLFGLNGMLLFNVVLLWGVIVAACRFLASRLAPPVAFAWALAFFAATIVPLYVVWLTSEIFNLALVFFAYWLWLSRESTPGGVPGRRRSRADWAADLAAAALLGLAIYSKPLNLLLLAPPPAYALWRRQWKRGLAFAGAGGLTVLLAFGATMAVTGEMNYQGGERKSFYGSFPFDSPGAGFHNRGIQYATDSVEPDVVLDTAVVVERFVDNVGYFIAGRYSGMLPYYLPGVVVLALCAAAIRRLEVWQLLIVGAVLATAVATIVLWPFTWAGGGGAAGNRYFLSIYPVLLFAIPTGSSAWTAAAAWAGAAFVAPILIQPFVSAKQPWRHAEHGLTRLLPVEMTMLNDLPILLDSGRGRRPYGENPRLLLYLLDDNAWLESQRIWVRGGSRTEIVARSAEPMSAFRVSIRSRVRNVVTVRAGGDTKRVDVGPGQAVVVTVEADGKYSRGARAYLLSIASETGFIPRLVDPTSTDGRYLGAAIELAGVPAR